MKTPERPNAVHPAKGGPADRLAGAVLAALCLLVVLLATGCGWEGTRSGGPPRVGDPIPEYRAARFATSDSLALSDLRGEVVLLNVWATWCGPCRQETPFLQSLHEAHRHEGLRVVGVSVDTRRSAGQIDTFLEEMGVEYDILHDPEMSAMDRFSVLGLPATFLVDRDGVIRFVRMGPIFEDDPAFLEALSETLS